MKKTVILTVLGCSFLSILGIFPGTVSAQQGQDAKGIQKSTTPETSVVFREVEPTIRSKSSVPPRLPRFLPYVDESHPIHAIIQTVTTSSYSILLANAVPCEGSNWCLYGTVRGSAQSFSNEGKARKAAPILLQGSIKASFFDSECGTCCSQAYIEWQENGFYYSIGIKGPNPMSKVLTKAANSSL